MILNKDEEEEGKDLLLRLFSDNPQGFLEDEEVSIDTSYAEGLHGEDIVVLEWMCDKERNINMFIKRLVANLEDEVLEELATQTDRFDDDLNFYIRLDKEGFEKGEWSIVTSGDCIHIRIHIAAYPAKRSAAEKKIKELFVDKIL